jgi:hypothetical protein
MAELFELEDDMGMQEGSMMENSDIRSPTYSPKKQITDHQ